MSERREQVKQWQRRSLIALVSARHLLNRGDWYGCANRAYYAAYQAGTGACIAHEDEDKFPPGWNNPTHEQLPDLIQNNGDLPKSARRQIRTHLGFLRQIREDADYRIGRTVNQEIAERCVRFSATVLSQLEVKEKSDEQA